MNLPLPPGTINLVLPGFVNESSGLVSFDDVFRVPVPTPVYHLYKDGVILGDNLSALDYVDKNELLESGQFHIALEEEGTSDAIEGEESGGASNQDVLDFINRFR